ncbi:MAG: 4Fe-4S dicluster domain-containing protein [Candidatus Hecatellales archaeon]|nr:MAG: 4Fe-4S dicluster domain-containing protein [Candidatus Hecatellales archaeon]
MEKGRGILRLISGLNFKILVVTPEKCTGCRICEMACSLHKEGVCSPSRSRIHVVKWEREGIDVPMVCWHCEDAPCAKACPVKAIYRDEETKAVLIDEDLCIGCRECMAVCPFGGVVMSDEGKMVKCDLCGGDPFCAKLCPTEAIQYAKPSSYILAKKREIALKVMETLRPTG